MPQAKPDLTSGNGEAKAGTVSGEATLAAGLAAPKSRRRTGKEMKLKKKGWQALFPTICALGVSTIS